MEKIIRELKNIFFEIVNDFVSSIDHAIDLLSSSSDKDKKIFSFIGIFILVILIFNSRSESVFYLNLIKLSLIVVISYFIYCLSDYFWFLVKRGLFYKYNISNEKKIKFLAKKVKKINFDYKENTSEEAISRIAEYNSEGYKRHVKRYAVEIFFLLLVIFFLNPVFIFYNIILFCGMFFYDFLFEDQFVSQILDDMKLLILSVAKLHKEDPEKLKKFITENESKEVKDLKIFYDIVLKIKLKVD